MKRLAFQSLENRLMLTTSAGDYNGDGLVNAADYTVWRDSLGSTSQLEADGDGNGSVGNEDRDVWASNYGAVAFEYEVTVSATESWRTPFPGEQSPASQGWTYSEGAWYRSGMRFTQFGGISGLISVAGHAYWQRDGIWFTNDFSDTHTVSTNNGLSIENMWGDIVRITPEVASDFSLVGGNAFFRTAEGHYFSKLMGKVQINSLPLGSDGPLHRFNSAAVFAPGGATDIELHGNKLFYKHGDQYFMNNAPERQARQLK